MTEVAEATVDNSDLIRSMQGMLHQAPEPAGFTPGEIIDKGNDIDSPPIIGHSVQSAGHVYIWDRRTGVRSITNRNMLAQQLKKQYPPEEGGGLMFTTSKPNIEPVQGQYKCLLHRDNNTITIDPTRPDRRVYDEWGFLTCRKANLISPHQVEQHMIHRHKTEWAAIERERAKQEKKIEQSRLEQHQKELVAAMTGRMNEAEVEPMRMRRREK